MQNKGGYIEPLILNNTYQTDALKTCDDCVSHPTEQLWHLFDVEFANNAAPQVGQGFFRKNGHRGARGLHDQPKLVGAALKPDKLTKNDEKQATK